MRTLYERSRSVGHATNKPRSPNVNLEWVTRMIYGRGVQIEGRMSSVAGKGATDIPLNHQPGECNGKKGYG